MSDAPMVSVIVPVYNGAKYLPECLDSLLTQSYSDFELILVDDGSDDGVTPGLCDEYAARDRRIRVIHRENGGLSAARNSGIEVACGEWLAFVDGDDLVDPDYLSVLLESAIEADAQVAVCATEWFLGMPEKLRRGPDGSIHELYDGVIVRTGREQCIIMDEYQGYYYTTAWSKIFKRSLFAELRFPEGRLYEDEFCIPKALYFSERVAETGKILYAYRRNPDGIISSPFTVRRADRVFSQEERMRFFASQGDDELYQFSRKNRDHVLKWVVEVARKCSLADELPSRYIELYEELYGPLKPLSAWEKASISLKRKIPRPIKVFLWRVIRVCRRLITGSPE